VVVLAGSIAGGIIAWTLSGKNGPIAANTGISPRGEQQAMSTLAQASLDPAVVAETTRTVAWRGTLSLEVKPLYGSLFHSYRDRPIGKLRVEAIDALERGHVSFRVQTRRKGQVTEEVLLVEDLIAELPSLEPGGVWMTDLRPKLSSAILSPADQEVTAEAVLYR